MGELIHPLSGAMAAGRFTETVVSRATRDRGDAEMCRHDARTHATVVRRGGTAAATAAVVVPLVVFLRAVPLDSAVAQCWNGPKTAYISSLLQGA